MKKLFTAAGLSILFITAAPALAASSDTACPVEDGWSESTTCDNGAYCTDDYADCYDEDTYCGNRPHHRGYWRGCNAGERYCW